MDISWISSQARDIHTFFVSIFYILATILLATGVLLDYFKLPIGGTPSFSQIVGRTLVAAILLVAYPEISNTVAGVSDAVADKLGSINSFSNVLQSAGAALKHHSWSWTSVGDTLLSVVAYVAYLFLYITVFFFDAAIIYSLTLLYIFSPLMIVFYILPSTSSLTSGLFRTLFEVAAWKIVFAVLGTLLWSTALNDFNQSGEGSFITLLALTLMLAFSVLLTPIVTRNLISGTISNIASQTAGLAAIGLSAGFLSPTALAGFTKKGSKVALRQTGRGISKTYKASKLATKHAKKKFTKQFTTNSKNEKEQ